MTTARDELVLELEEWAQAYPWQLSPELVRIRDIAARLAALPVVDAEQVRALAEDLDEHGGWAAGRCAERLRALLPESESALPKAGSDAPERTTTAGASSCATTAAAEREANIAELAKQFVDAMLHLSPTDVVHSWTALRDAALREQEKDEVKA